MISRDFLLEQYKIVLAEQNKQFNLCLITNSNAKKGGILLVGINPSGEPIGNHVDPFEYERCDTKTFWYPKHHMMGKEQDYNYDENCAYIDLIPVRTKDQNQLKQYLDSENALMGALLSYTQDYIEELSPRLIIFANSMTGLWGLDKKEKKNCSIEGGCEYTNVWMGYDFKPVNSPLNGHEDKGNWPFYQITGIIPSEVNRGRTETNLKGTYFLRYGQHKTRRGQIPIRKRLTPNDIKTIVEWIDPVWAKNLL